MLKSPKSILKSTEGFTLVELMVVVAIIGILSAVAIPNYQKYQAKARQSEAKIALASAYTALQSFFAENGSYTACLSRIGYQPELNAKRFYATGLSATSANCGIGAAPPNTSCLRSQWDATGTPTDAAACVIATDAQWAANSGVGGGTVAPVGDIPAAALITGRTTFIVGAGGRINGGVVADQWTMNQNKILSNTVSTL